MKVLCIRGTTLSGGRIVNEGEIIEIAPEIYRMLRNDFVEYVEVTKPVEVVSADASRTTKKGK